MTGLSEANHDTPVGARPSALYGSALQPQSLPSLRSSDRLTPIEQRRAENWAQIEGLIHDFDSLDQQNLELRQKLLAYEEQQKS